MSVMGGKGGKRASMAFLITAGALLVVLVSLSFPSLADAGRRPPYYGTKPLSPPPKKHIYMPPTPTKKPIYVPPRPPKKSPPPPPKPTHYVPMKSPKKPVNPTKPKSPPPPYKPDHLPSTVFTPAKFTLKLPPGFGPAFGRGAPYFPYLIPPPGG